MDVWYVTILTQEYQTAGESQCCVQYPEQFAHVSQLYSRVLKIGNFAKRFYIFYIFLYIYNVFLYFQVLQFTALG